MKTWIHVKEIKISYTIVQSIEVDQFVGPFDFAKYLQNEFTYTEQEQILVCPLNNQNAPIGFRMVSLGLINTAPIHAREIFRPCIELGACSLIMAHNHPSGGVEPSLEDLKATRNIWEAGELLGIPLLDHLIISPGQGLNFHSIKSSNPNLFRI